MVFSIVSKQVPIFPSTIRCRFWRKTSVFSKKISNNNDGVKQVEDIYYKLRKQTDRKEKRKEYVF